ncbi:MAG: Gfo/Idh/MocA family oxidoreductase [Pirellulaceae bacterium]|nr:Gfo/Idh/MocA family oxidoreductase [Planctomycetales bacterium]
MSNVRIGVVGLGYWGPNLVRCLARNPACDVTYVCDRDASRLKNIASQFPAIRPTDEIDDVLSGDDVDAVVIATPTKTHFAMAKSALAHGKHVFVEKPLATNSDECRELIELADLKGLTLFVGHVFLHSSPVNKLRELIRTGALGDIYYISSKRLNLGPVRRDVNALWDLAPHDVSVMIDLLGTSPLAVSCCGSSYLNAGIQDVCNLTLHFPGDRLGIVHVSWLDPRKDREMTVVGSEKMVVYDDLEPLEKIKVYDRGVEAPPTNSFGEFQYSYRYGDMYSPRLEQFEPLAAECNDFIRAITDGGVPLTDGINGLRVVEVLEAAGESLRLGGSCVRVPHWSRTDSHLVRKRARPASIAAG